MMARSPTRSDQRPDTLTQDRICQVDQTSCNARPDHTLGSKAVRFRSSKCFPVLTQVYGPAVRCKRFCRAWRQRSCINVSGLWLEHLPRAIMDISAHAVSLADRPQPGHLGHQCSHAPGRPILHHRLILSQTPGRGKGSIISSIASSGLLLFLCSCLAAVPSSRPSQVQRCAARKDRQGWPSRLPCLSHWRGQATP